MGWGKAKAAETVAREMRYTRGNSGFTMLELMVVIALVVAMGAIAFISISQYLRSSYQHEMDETAKSIYIAAQNHLTVADSLGALSGKTTGSRDEVTEEGATEDADIYYYVLPKDKASLSNKKSMLATMLPVGSIDEAVRTGGSYIIRYQYKPGFKATVLDVFYANASEGRFLQGGFSHTFTDEDFATLFSDAKYRATDATGEAARSNYNGSIIGYYGGAGASGISEALPVPRLEIVNAEVLSGRLTNLKDYANSVRFEFYITGETSKAISKPITATRSSAFRKDGVNGGNLSIEAIFDSVTRDGCHFAELESSVEGVDFIPGENIEIQLFAIDTESTKVSKSTKRTVNSLFASLGSTEASSLLESFDTPTVVAGSQGMQTEATPTTSSPKVVKIANIRHLENLSNAVSSYNPTALGADMPASYEQTLDLSWPDFCKKVVGLTANLDGTMPADTSESLAVQIHPMTGSASKAHTFMPISWTTGTLAYKGGGHKVTGIEIDSSGNAGLFGTIAGSASAQSSIEDLELLDFKVVSRNGYAGTLAGQASWTDVTRVFAHDESDDSTLGVTQTGTTGAVGGLLGRLEGGSVTGCAAAVYVSGVNVAGGLIGQATDRAAVRYSYSGGHTANGAYENGRYAANVTATLTAGGLVGSFTSGTITGCYSTCSVDADTTADRFVGSNGATTSDCYAVGSVKGEAWMKTDISGNTLTTETYDALVGGGKNGAEPYDVTLKTGYGAMYPFKAIAEVKGASDALGLASAPETALVKHLNTHYGDWPAIVTVVVNDWS